MHCTHSCTLSELCESGESFTATDVRNAYQGQLCQNAMLLECYAEYLTQIHERVGIDRAMKTLELRTYQQTLLRDMCVEIQVK
nr:hypothetical protein [Prevotella disiens]